MVQLTLPADSRVNKQGRVFKAPAGAKRARTFGSRPQHSPADKRTRNTACRTK